MTTSRYIRMWTARMVLAVMMLAALVFLALLKVDVNGAMWFGGKHVSLLWWLFQFLVTIAAGVSVLICVGFGTVKLFNAAFPEEDM